jgi:hypothetical protein
VFNSNILLNWPIMETKLIATILGVALVLATTSALPMGVARAQAQINTPRGNGICTGICTGPLASLTDKWWQLMLSTDITNPLTPNPFTNTYKGDCSQLMPANTLFLAGQINPLPGVIFHGTCTISPQTSVLFPLINAVDVDCQSLNQHKPTGVCAVPVAHPARGQPFGPLRSLASVGSATNLAASLDGVPLQFVRAQSPPGGFETTFAAHDIFGFNIGVPVMLHGVADGFWVLLPSLPIGTHLLEFGGCLPSTGCQTNTYTLVVR